MANELAGRIALVTGGSGGIGLAIAQRFVGEGAQVVLAGLASGDLPALCHVIDHGQG